MSPRKNSGSHIDASLSRQPLVKGERLVRYEVNAVMQESTQRAAAYSDSVCRFMVRDVFYTLRTTQSATHYQHQQVPNPRGDPAETPKQLKSPCAQPAGHAPNPPAPGAPTPPLPSHAPSLPDTP